MFNKKFFKTYVLVSAALLLIFPLLTSTSESAQDPSSAAYYSPENDRLFWFIQVSDLHINVEKPQSSSNLTWLVGEARTAIDPEFIVATGDLTDSVFESGFFDIPNGPHLVEWVEYWEILVDNDINKDNYYDIPGNHDAYNDQFFDYYLANSIQGPFHQGRTQFSWVRNFIFGNYHFLGVNTADNSGETWWGPHFGDNAGLDALELPFIQEELELHSSATLSMIFGHHPIRHKGTSTDTYLRYGANEFIDLMDFYNVSMYAYGHLHEFSEEFFTNSEAIEGLYYLNVNTLGKSNVNNYNIIAIDSNGISIRNKDLRSWPAVVITAPVDVDLGVADNPYTYYVPNSSANPIRALVFDVNEVTSVEYRIGTINANSPVSWSVRQTMDQVVNNPYLWEASREPSTGRIWDASNLSEGYYIIEVLAEVKEGSNVIRSDTDTITTYVYQQLGANNPPVANNIVHSINKDTTLTVPAPGVLANDYDPDFDPITAVLDSGPENGTLEFFYADGSFKYTPGPGFSGLDSFTYTASDVSLSSDPATVTIIVNEPPVAVDDSYSTDGARLEVAAPGVLGNDSDLDEGDKLIATLVYGPSNGSLTLNPDGSFDYTPDSGFAGDTFTYKASDGMAYSNEATVFIPDGAVNIPPVANEGSATTPKDTPVGITLSASDQDGPLPLTYTVVTPPSNGSLSGIAPELIYTPNGIDTDPDSFNFKVYDGQANSDVATVSITVNAVNDAPVAVDDSYSTYEDTPLIVPVLDGVLKNDSDFEGDTLTAILVSGPSNGSLTLNPDGSFDYTPGSSFTGTASFTYKANDGAADSNPATVTITVNAVNNPPVAAPDTATTDEDTSVNVNVLKNDSDPDGDPLVVISVTDPPHGVAVANEDGTITYTPDPDYHGSDSFGYTIDDGKGNTDSATVTITVNSIEDSPVAVNDSDSTDEDTPVTVNVLANDSDADGDSPGVISATDPASGSVVINPDDTITYTPDLNFSGVDSFSYTIDDGKGNTDSATVTITVNPAGTVDEVTISSAVYKDKPKRLVVEATSTNSSAMLTVEAYSSSGNIILEGTTMTNSEGIFSFNAKVSSEPITVTVTSSEGGSATCNLDGGACGDGSGTEPPSTTDVTITKAVYERKTKLLTVEATSSVSGAILTLTVVGYEDVIMAFDGNKYTFTLAVQKKPRSVTVISDSDEEATRRVSGK